MTFFFSSLNFFVQRSFFSLVLFNLILHQLFTVSKKYPPWKSMSSMGTFQISSDFQLYLSTLHLVPEMITNSLTSQTKIFHQSYVQYKNLLTYSHKRSVSYFFLNFTSDVFSFPQETHTLIRCVFSLFSKCHSCILSSVHRRASGSPPRSPPPSQPLPPNPRLLKRGPLPLSP